MMSQKNKRKVKLIRGLLRKQVMTTEKSKNKKIIKYKVFRRSFDDRLWSIAEHLPNKYLMEYFPGETTRARYNTKLFVLCSIPEILINKNLEIWKVECGETSEIMKVVNINGFNVNNIYRRIMAYWENHRNDKSGKIKNVSYAPVGTEITDWVKPIRRIG